MRLWNTASWPFVRQYQFVATRGTDCFCVPNMETTVPFGRAIGVYNRSLSHRKLERRETFMQVEECLPGAAEA